MTAAPTIGVFVDGNEDIAFDYLNEAGIPDRLGQAWPNGIDGSGVYAGFPDILDTGEISGPTSGGPADGILMASPGVPEYCQLTSMHYDDGQITDEEVREVREWLTIGASHAFMECEAVLAF